MDEFPLSPWSAHKVPTLFLSLPLLPNQAIWNSVSEPFMRPRNLSHIFAIQENVG